MKKTIESLQVEKSRKVAIKLVDESYLALSLETGELFSLNETAARILELCEKPVALSQITETIASGSSKKHGSMKKTVEILEMFVKSRIVRLSF